MDLGLTDAVAIVTASSKGLGLGTAKALSAEGAKVVLCARDEARLQAAADALPGETLAIAADVTDPATPARLVDAALERFGALHVVVANAGGPPQARALETDDEGMLAAVNANMLTSIRLVDAAVPHLRSAGWGRICLIASNAVKQPIPTLAYSNASRAGLWAWAKTAAQDLINSGDIVAIAEVVRDLYRSETQPEQSYSERQLYEAALDRLSREISAVQHITETEAVKEIEAALAKGPRRGPKPADEADAVEEEAA